MIKVNSLGRFQISDGVSVINESNLRSHMLIKLLMFLILHREKSISNDEISRALWDDAELENSAGALKNLAYRLRKTLKEAYPGLDLIITSRGSYAINPEIEIVLDVDEFKNFISEANLENNIEIAIEKYESAIDVYKGEVLANFTDIHWVTTLNTYYHSMYLSAVKALAELYKKVKKYNKLEALVTSALRYENADEQLFCYQIEAHMRMGQVTHAFDSYQNAREIIEKEIGIRQTNILNKVYEELITMTKGQDSYKMSDVKKDITEESQEGVFFCGYPIFRKIYQLEVRKCSRNNIPENLLLLTIITKKIDSSEAHEYFVKRAMESLKMTLMKCLRLGDVAAKYSDTQYIILLPTCTSELASVVADRIISTFYRDYPAQKKVKIETNIEALSQRGSIVEESDSMDEGE